MPPRPPEFFEAHPSDHLEEETNSILDRQLLQDEIGNCDVSFNKEGRTQGHRIYVIFDKKDDITVEVTMRYKIENNGENFVFTNLTTLPSKEEVLRKGYASKVVQAILHQVISNYKRIIATQVSTRFSEVSQNFWIKNGFKRCEEPNPTSDFEFIKR